MIRPLVVRGVPAVWMLLAWMVAGLSWLASSPATSPAMAEPAPTPETHPGQFFPISEPITSEVIAHIKAATRQLIDRSAARGQEPVLVFEFRPRRGLRRVPATSARATTWRTSSPRSLKAPSGPWPTFPSRFTATRCSWPWPATRSSWGPTASLGPITPEGQAVDPAQPRAGPVPGDPQRMAHPDLLLGMLDRDADLRAVRTADKQLHYVLAENLPEFQKTAPGDRGRSGLGRGSARRPDRQTGARRGASSS